MFSTSYVLSCVSSSAIVVVVDQWLMHGRRNTLETTSDSRLLFALRANMSPLSFSEASRPSVGREPALEPIRSKRFGLQACGQQLSCTPAKESYSDSYLCYLNSYQDSTGYLEAIWGLDSSRG